MAHTSYGSFSEPPEVVFGVPRAASSNATKAKFDQVSFLIWQQFYIFDCFTLTVERINQH